MNLNLTGQTALVTASSGGIGFAIARSLAGEGARVIVNGRSEVSTAKAVARLRAALPDAQLEALAVDNGTKQGVETTIATFPEIDLLVNNLGIYEVNSFFEESDETWSRLFDVNVLSGVRLSRHYLRKMIERKKGRVVFIASEAAISPPADMAAYSATKAVQLSLSRSLAELTKGTEVTVNTVMPSSTKTEGVTEMLAKMFPELSAEAADREFMRRNRPTSLSERLIKPEEIGDLVAFLCSNRAAAINGAALRADGGLVRHMV
jgi:3-oxoacyl-[acyl-carrier protein] reductase